MAFQAYVSIKGTKQGQLKGESKNPRRKDWIEVLAFSYEVISPRDRQSGLAAGKRQHKPVVIRKQWGAATPQLLQALTNNEILESVAFEFEKVGPDGKEYVYQTIKLTNATVSDDELYTPICECQPSPQTEFDSQELERVAFTFQKIQITNNDGQTTYVDDWEE
jgi:type VI secretion system secreted protein Hcp